MKKLIAIIFLCLFSQQTFAYDIKLHAPFSSTGNAQNIIRILAEGLAEKGWDLNIKITGNPKLSKETYNKTTEPFLLAYASDTASSKSDVHYMTPPTTKDFVTSLYSFQLFICTIKDLDVDDFLNKNKSYKIGITQDPVSPMYMNALQKYLGTNHKLLRYDGSKKVGLALFSGEIDFSFSSKGAKYVNTGKAKCLYGTGAKSVLGIKTIKSAYPEWNLNTLPGVVYLRAKNIPADKLEQLRNDFQELQSSYAPYLEYVNTRFYGTPTGTSLKAQVDIIKKLDSALK